MTVARLWTKDFMALIMANTMLFGGFHFLLPTLPMYAALKGYSGTEIGLITGIFGFSAIFIRLFTDWGVAKFGKKRCLYIGLILSWLATISYMMFTTVNELIIARIIHGFGFGLTTTFSAALVVDIIPAARRGEGIGYFGLGSTVAMALAPAAGVWLFNDFGYEMMFLASAAATCLAIVSARIAASPVAEVPVQHKTKLWHKLFEKGTGVAAVLTVFFGFSYGSVNTFVAMLAKEAGIADAGLFFIVGTICVFISRPFGGRLFDRKGAVWVILPGALLFSLALLTLLNVSALLQLLVAAVLYGFGGGLLLPALMAWLINSVQPHRRSGASATFYNMLDVGTSAGIMFLGSVAGEIGYIAMYKYALYAMLAFVILFVLQTIIAKPQQKLQNELAE